MSVTEPESPLPPDRPRAVHDLAPETEPVDRYSTQEPATTDGPVAAVQRRWITEDWAATATGLVLLLLLLSGILPKGWLL